MPLPRKRINVELLLGLSATFLSLAALIVSIVQTKIARDQQHASVWPYLETEVFMTNDSDSTKDQLQLKLMNNGVGPAIIRQASVQYKTNPYRTHFEVFEMGIDSLRGEKIESFRTLDRNKVLKPGEEWTLYEVARNRTAVRLVNKIANDSSFHLKIYYADVYGNCWLLDRNKVTELSQCPN